MHDVSDSKSVQIEHAARNVRMGLGVALLLAAATMATHGWALGDGLFLDDHWHQKQLRDRGWSWSDLLQTATIEPDRFMETWWQESPIRWQYARPVSILLMKLVYHATDGNVPAQHAVSILLHFINACMVYVLCTWLTAHRFWSIVGALLFVIYSHSVFAVGWLAAQNTVLQTALMFAAMLVYIRASGLQLLPWRGVLPTPGLKRQSPLHRRGQRGVLPTPKMRRGLFTWVIILFVLALLSRENAIMLPVILVALDLAFGGRRHLRARRAVYASLALLSAAFLIWRLVYFYHPLPDVYFRRPESMGAYLPWCVAKLMHYLCSAVWLSPMTVGPTGRFNPFTEVPGDCLLMFAILAVMGIGYTLACRNARGYWIWPMWLVLSFLPVVPILATPHSGYLAGVAFAVAMVLGPGLRNHIRPVSVGRWSRPVAIWFLIATTTYIPIYRTLWQGMVAAERYTIAKITADPTPTGVTDVFFINVPFVNIYGKLCLEEAWGPAVANVRCHALTYAPDLAGMEGRCTLEQKDAYSFYLSVEGWPYFSGLLGRYLIGSVRDSGRLRAGQLIRGDLFDATVVEADGDGVRKLLFTFRRPLADDGHRFYLTTRACVAAQVRFRPPDWQVPKLKPLAETMPNQQDIDAAGRRLAKGDAAAAHVLLAGMHSGEAGVRRESRLAFRHVALPVAEAMAAPVQALIEDDRPTPAALAEIRQWWASSVDDGILEALWLRRSEFEEIREDRDGIATVRGNAAWVIKTDLYLTGPPFPGPR